MGNSRGKITAPVSVNDVRYVLGAASKDVGTLCSHRNINMWSKCKPVHFSSLNSNNNWKGAPYDITEQDYKAVYGLSFPSFGIGEFAERAVEKVEYNKPIGGLKSPYRLADFNGYVHNCKCPWNIKMPEGAFFANQNALVRFVKLTPSVQLPDGNLTAEELLYALNDADPSVEGSKKLNVCVAVRSSDGQIVFKTFAEDSPTLDISDCGLYETGETLEVFVVFCSKASAGWSDGSDNFETARFYSISNNTVEPYSIVNIGQMFENSWTIRMAFDGSPLVMSIDNRTVNVRDGVLYAQASWTTTRPSKDFVLDSISVTREELLPDGNRGPKETYTEPITDAVSPQEIVKSDWVDTQGSGTINVTVPVHPVSGKAYSFAYTLNYK